MSKITVLDTVEIIGKTLVSMIPVGGALITSVWDVVKGNCLSKRQELWRNALEERLSKLETTLEEIGKNMGLTKERVRQIKEKALKKLRSEALNNSITSDIYK